MGTAEGIDPSFADGARAVELARDAIESYVRHGTREDPGSMREAFYARTGAFVRIESALGGLRGCAGSYDGDRHLGRAIIDAAITAASDGSGGSEVGPAELSTVTVSVCIVRNVLLTDDPLADIELGVHGLAVDGDGRRGWIYPTIPTDHGWSVPEYLDRTCRKAGLPPGAWERDDVLVTLFEGAVFREREPGGPIELP